MARPLRLEFAGASTRDDVRCAGSPACLIQDHYALHDEHAKRQWANSIETGLYVFPMTSTLNVLHTMDYGCLPLRQLTLSPPPVQLGQRCQ